MLRLVFRRLRYGIVLITGLLACSMAAAASPTLRFVVYHPHFPPYIFINDGEQQVIGIIPDLLAPFFAAEGVATEYLFDNRSGAEQRLYKGDVDAMMLSPEWATHPEQLLFSAGIIPYHDFLFARTPEEVVQLDSELKDKKICTREYYVYPELETFFAKGEMLRLDSSSQEAQMRMVQIKRCDLVYMNDLIANWLLQRRFENQQLFASKLLIGKTELKIALHPRWKNLLPKLNAFLRQQQKNGELDKVIQRYVKP